MILSILNPHNNKIETFVQEDEVRKTKFKKYNFNHFQLNKSNAKILQKYNKNQENLNLISLKFLLQMIPLVINQEYEIAKLQNFIKVQNNSLIYELLFLGLQEKFLDFNNSIPIIKVFYETNRITEKQYKTLIEQLYLYDKEYEDND